MRHTEKECKGIHCRCMQKDCTKQHYSDHVQDCGHTNIDHSENGCKNITVSSIDVPHIEAFAVVTNKGEYIGSGQRGKMYLYWDRDDAIEYVNAAENKVKDLFQKPLDWKIVSVVIS